MRLLEPQEPEGLEISRQLLGQHADALVHGLTAACTTTHDMGVAAAIQHAAAAVCSGAPEYMAELFVDRSAEPSMCVSAPSTKLINLKRKCVYI